MWEEINGSVCRSLHVRVCMGVDVCRGVKLSSFCLFLSGISGLYNNTLDLSIPVGISELKASSVQ